MEKFRKLNLSEPFLGTIKEFNFEAPSEIQEKAIPLILEGKDVIAGSATGSGKTLAFGAGIIEKAEKGKGIGALVLTPTRELAEQVSNSLIKFSKHKHLNIIAVYGGVGIDNQMRDLRNADVVVGTPGRILDHLQRRTINLSQVSMLVLDEADRMLDMGFLDDVEKIISQCPKKRQTLLFSATISSEVYHIAKKHMISPTEVSAESYVDASKLEQIYYDTPSQIKFSFLVHLLKQEKSDLVLVFCNTRSNVDFVAKNLRNQDIDAIVIHGGLSQNRRTQALDDFHNGKVVVLVCTDVAARGLDIKNVSHVYNYDVPKTSKDYIHRIGRTARAGKEGKAVTILSERDYENFHNVLREDSIKIERKEVPESIERVRIEINRERYEDRRRPFSDRSNFERGSGRFNRPMSRRRTGDSRTNESGSGRFRSRSRDY